jgi:hypothetical protein
MLDALEQLADLSEIKLGNKHRRVEIQLAFARWQEPRKDTNRLITGADVASDRKPFAIFWRKTDARSRDQRSDEAFEIEGVGDVLGLIPTDRTRRAGEQDAEGFDLPPPALRNTRPISKSRNDFACWRTLRTAEATSPGIMLGRITA